MKKSLIPIVLLALLIAVMSSGSLAIYTQTQTLRGQLYTRIFLFTGSEKATSYEFGLSGLSLSPGQGETELYRFSLTNANDGGTVSDYGMTVSIASSGMASAASAMKGLVFYLYDAGAEGGGPLATVSAGELAVSGIRFPAGLSKTTEYRLTARWADNGDSAAQTALAMSRQQYPVHITVTAQAEP